MLKVFLKTPPGDCRMSKFYQVIEQLKNEQKTWLVTGNAGFIGSNLTEFLLNHNQKVVGLDNFSTGYQHNIDDVLDSISEEKRENFIFIEGDIADYAICEKACVGVDIVLHQAALGSVPRSIADPVTSNHSNVTGFLNILTAAKDAAVKRFVFASSSSVYGDSAELPKIEEHIGNLLSPYATTKRTGELYAEVFTRTYGMETIGLRYFNVFGRRQDPNSTYSAVIPKWVYSLIHNEAVYINGDGETSRDFTYIDNIIQMNILAGVTDNSDSYGEVFNVATGGRKTLNDLYSAIDTELENNLSSYSSTKANYREFRAGDIRHSHADISKASDLVGYAPAYTLDQGLSKAIAWYIQKATKDF